MKSNCDDCVYFVYDEDAEAYVCTMDLDEDEMERYHAKSYDTCPFYHRNDEYGTVKKQN